MSATNAPRLHGGGALLVDRRWIGAHGIGRFATEVLSRLPEATPLATSLPL